MRVLSFEYQFSDLPYETKSVLTGNLQVLEPWDADEVFDGIADDLADIAFDSTNDTLLLLSQESSLLMRVSPDSGAVLESLALTGSRYFEGVTFFDGCRIAVLAEPNFLALYRPGK